MPNLPTEDELKQQIDKLIPCVQCDGSGAYAVDNGYGEPEPEQCQYCYQYRFPAIDNLAELIHHYATKRELELEFKILKRIESMGDGEAHRQGNFSAHNMDDFHRAYGEIVAHNVHERIAELKAQKEQESKS